MSEECMSEECLSRGDIFVEQDRSAASVQLTQVREISPEVSPPQPNQKSQMSCCLAKIAFRNTRKGEGKVRPNPCAF